MEIGGYEGVKAARHLGGLSLEQGPLTDEWCGTAAPVNEKEDQHKY